MPFYLGKQQRYRGFFTRGSCCPTQDEILVNNCFLIQLCKNEERGKKYVYKYFKADYSYREKYFLTKTDFSLKDQ